MRIRIPYSLYTMKMSTRMRWLRWILPLVTILLVLHLLQPNARKDNDLDHFVNHRYLSHYLSNVKVLIEPLKTPCERIKIIPLIVLVNSAPHHIALRHAIRETWGTHLLTYFYLGCGGNSSRADCMRNQQEEANLYEDMIVFDFKEHYQNLTIKTGLMMQWVQERCPRAEFLLKVDDDSFVNPWMLKYILKSKGAEVKLIGHLQRNIIPNRDQRKKWYLPEWLYKDQVIPFFLSGPGYVINMTYLHSILQTALSVPLHNLEDVYYTYNVANKTLDYELSHDDMFSPYRPQPQWFPCPSCAYWTQATMHSFDAIDMVTIWEKISNLSCEYIRGDNVCYVFRICLKPLIYMSIVEK